MQKADLDTTKLVWQLLSLDNRVLGESNSHAQLMRRRLALLDRGIDCRIVDRECGPWRGTYVV